MGRRVGYSFFPSPQGMRDSEVFFPGFCRVFCFFCDLFLFWKNTVGVGASIPVLPEKTEVRHIEDLFSLSEAVERGVGESGAGNLLRKIV
jgi:hypothetical protein